MSDCVVFYEWSKESSERYMCTACDTLFTTTAERDQHYEKTHVIPRPQCEMCNKEFITEKALEKHLDIKHLDRASKYTTECPLCFAQVQQLRAHIRQIHEKKQKKDMYGGTCPHCNKTFVNDYKVKRHILQVHDNIRPFTCTECDKSFLDKKDLKRHILGVHLGEKVNRWGKQTSASTESTQIIKKQFQLADGSSCLSQAEPTMAGTYGSTGIYFSADSLGPDIQTRPPELLVAEEELLVAEEELLVAEEELLVAADKETQVLVPEDDLQVAQEELLVAEEEMEIVNPMFHSEIPELQIVMHSALVKQEMLPSCPNGILSPGGGLVSASQLGGEPVVSLDTLDTLHLLGSHGDPSSSSRSCTLSSNPASEVHFGELEASGNHLRVTQFSTEDIESANGQLYVPVEDMTASEGQISVPVYSVRGVEDGRGQISVPLFEPEDVGAQGEPIHGTSTLPTEVETVTIAYSINCDVEGDIDTSSEGHPVSGADTKLGGLLVTGVQTSSSRDPALQRRKGLKPSDLIVGRKYGKQPESLLLDRFIVSPATVIQNQGSLPVMYVECAAGHSVNSTMSMTSSSQMTRTTNQDTGSTEQECIFLEMIGEEEEEKENSSVEDEQEEYLEAGDPEEGHESVQPEAEDGMMDEYLVERNNSAAQERGEEDLEGGVESGDEGLEGGGVAELLVSGDQKEDPACEPRYRVAKTRRDSTGDLVLELEEKEKAAVELVTACTKYITLRWGEEVVVRPRSSTFPFPTVDGRLPELLFSEEIREPQPEAPTTGLNPLSLGEGHSGEAPALVENDSPLTIDDSTVEDAVGVAVSPPQPLDRAENETKVVSSKKIRKRNPEPRVVDENTVGCLQPGCQQVFRGKSNMLQYQRHYERVHLQVKHHVCKFCLFKFYSKYDLVRHIESVHSKIKTVCPIVGCNTLIVRLDLHIKNVHNQTPPKQKDKSLTACAECGQNFNRVYDLKRHKDTVHSGWKRFKCTVCERGFADKRDMQRHHGAVHLKIKQNKVYSCTHCGTQCRLKKDLVQHLASLECRTSRPTSIPGVQG